MVMSVLCATLGLISGDVQSIRADVTYLASDRLAGRGTGEPGNALAAGHVASRFAALGLTPGAATNQWLQPFKVAMGNRPGSSSTIKIDGRGIKGSSSVMVHPRSGSGNVAANIVAASPGAALKGAIAVVPLPPDSGLIKQAGLVAAARDAGAVGVILLADTNPDGAFGIHVEGPGADYGLPVVVMLKSAFSPSGRLPERGSLSLTMVPFEVTTNNVIGVLPGTDPQLSKEVVVVGAHLDHLGMGGASSLSDSKSPAIHHGADDNASGTSALIEIASILSSPANRPKRTVVFIAFSGEELGLLGSVHYVKNPVYAIKDTVAMVNLDMVGRMKDKSRLSLIGVKTSPGWESVVSPLVKRSGLNVVLEDSTSGGSDHQPFQAAKVPVTFFFTGLHADYHRPSDTVDKLDIDGIAKVSQLAARVVERVADARERLVFSEPPAAAGGSSTMRAKASLGTIPEYGAGVIGVLVGGVRAGSPAEKAGLQAGDILVGFAGKTIRSIEEYTAALGEANPGDVVELKVDRKGKILLMKATLAESRR